MLASFMNEYLKSVILSATGATELVTLGEIQSLWSGYGSIVRYGLNDASIQSVVVKHVSLPETVAHPRGWHTDLSHQRKLKSYAAIRFSASGKGFGTTAERRTPLSPITSPVTLISSF